MFFDCIFDEWGTSFNPLNIAEKYRVTCSRSHTSTFKLMQFKPILLLTSLRTIFDLLTPGAFRTGIEWYKLLVKFFIVFNRALNAILLVFPNVLKRTFIVSALAHMNHFIIRRCEIHIRLFSRTDHHSTCIHHCVIDA